MVFRKGKSLVKWLRLRGWRYLGYLVTGYLVPRMIFALYLSRDEQISIRGIRRQLMLACALLGFAVWVLISVIVGQPLVVLALMAGVVAVAGGVVFFRRARRLDSLLEQAKILTEQKRPRAEFTSWEHHISDPQARAEITRRMQNEREIVLAELDANGRALDHVDALTFLARVPEEDFIPKDRYKLSVVLRDDRLLVRKQYGDDRSAFIREWFALAFLQDRANVPAVWRGDVENNTLYMNLIPGRSLQHRLDAAKNESHQVNRPDLKGKALQVLQDEQNRKLIAEVVPEKTLDELDRQLDIIHASGISGVVLKPGNIVLSDLEDKPYVVDFHMHSQRPPHQLGHQLMRDKDRLIANRRLGRDLMTERQARQALTDNTSHWYAPLDFGYGLTVGKFWAVASGTGRWNVLMRQGMPALQDQRVLDLGSNNGCMPMMMMRAGASQVVGVELSEEYYHQAQLVHRLFEWRDMRPYDFQLHLGNMLDILTEDWGKFDIVTALCTLYYLQEEDMGRIVARAAEIAPIMVIQANRRASVLSDLDKPRRASVDFLTDLLRKNGFPTTHLYDPPGTTRPLVIGYRDAAAS